MSASSDVPFPGQRAETVNQDANSAPRSAARHATNDAYRWLSWLEASKMLEHRSGSARVGQPGKKLGRPKVSPKVENAIRMHLSAGMGILKVAALVRRRERHYAARRAGVGGDKGGGTRGLVHTNFQPCGLLTTPRYWRHANPAVRSVPGLSRRHACGQIAVMSRFS